MWTNIRHSPWPITRPSTRGTGAINYRSRFRVIFKTVKKPKITEFSGLYSIGNKIDAEEY